ncbi:hypothetical protein D3C71_1993540 [compost metagenome]
MSQIEVDVALPGLYPPNDENKARYQAWAHSQNPQGWRPTVAHAHLRHRRLGRLDGRLDFRQLLGPSRSSKDLQPIV